MARALAEFFRHHAKVRGARIFRAIDAMAHTRDLDLVREHFVHALHGFIGGAHFEQHLITSSLAPPCSGPLRAPMAEVTRRINIGKCGGGDARGEGGSVQFVIGVQRERNVENVVHHFVGLLAGEAIEEVAGKAQAGVGSDDRLAGAQAPEAC